MTKINTSNNWASATGSQNISSSNDPTTFDYWDNPASTSVTDTTGAALQGIQQANQNSPSTASSNASSKAPVSSTVAGTDTSYDVEQDEIKKAEKDYADKQYQINHGQDSLTTTSTHNDPNSLEVSARAARRRLRNI